MARENIELEAAIVASDMVTVCWEPDCNMHRLYYWPVDKWVEHEKKEDYTQYTHSICEYHYQLYHEEIERATSEGVVEQATEAKLVASAA